jgi:hypothetical protein
MVRPILKADLINPTSDPFQRNLPAEPRFAFNKYDGDWRRPSLPRLQLVFKKLSDKKYAKTLAAAFKREVIVRLDASGNEVNIHDESAYGLETVGRMYCFLISDAFKSVCGKKFGDHRSILTANDIEKLQTPAAWLNAGPDPADQKGLTPRESKAALQARQRLLELVVTVFEELQIMSELKTFANKQFGSGQASAVVLHELFARYYAASSDGASLGLETVVTVQGKKRRLSEEDRTTTASRSYPLHYDPHNFTVVLTLPTTTYAEDGGMQLTIYDPQGKASYLWKQGVVIGPDSYNLMQQFEHLGLVHPLKIDPFSYAMMANPTLHSVTELVKGDRISIVGFFGLTG